MRYDTLVTFWKEQDFYNPVTRKHEKKNIQLTQMFCNVTDLGIQRQVELLGGIDESSKTVRMMSLPPSEYDYIKIKGINEKYRFISSLNVQKGYAMIAGVDNGRSKNRGNGSIS